MSRHILHIDCKCILCTADGNSSKKIPSTKWNIHIKQAEREEKRQHQLLIDSNASSPNDGLQRAVFRMAINDQLGSHSIQVGLPSSQSDSDSSHHRHEDKSEDESNFDMGEILATVNSILDDSEKTVLKGSENLKKAPVLGFISRPFADILKRRMASSEKHVATVKAMKKLRRAEEEVQYVQMQIASVKLSSQQDIESSIAAIRQEIKGIKRDVPKVQDLRSQLLKNLIEAENALQAHADYISDSAGEGPPIKFNSEHHFDPPIDKCDPIARVTLFLAVYCSVILCVGRRQATFIIQCLSHIIRLVFMRCRNGSLLPHDSTIVDQIPYTIDTALSRFNLDKSKLVVYAICPECNCTHAPSYVSGSDRPVYPRKCGNIANLPNSPDLPTLPCNQEITYLKLGTTNEFIPYKVFHYYPVQEYIAGLLSQPELEKVLDESFDLALAAKDKKPDVVTGFFDGEFVRSYKGPDGERLFIDRGEETRIFFSLNVDFFNINMNLQRGASTSCGIISMACLNLPPDIRYKPENMYLAGVTPGPSEPTVTQFNHFLHPLMDDLTILWKRGIYFSHTSLSPTGKFVRSALALCVCDLPAARKACGLAGVKANHYCTSCTCHDRKTLGDTNVEDWVHRNDKELKMQAIAWRDAFHEPARKEIFDKYGCRWSDIWQLEFSPSTQLVPDPMHCLLENLASNHFREYLTLTSQAANVKDEKSQAFQFQFQEYDPAIQTRTYDKATVITVVDQLNSLTGEAIMKMGTDRIIQQLKCNFPLQALQSTCEHLQIHPIHKTRTPAKADYAQCLLSWCKARKGLEVDEVIERRNDGMETMKLNVNNRSKEVSNIHKLLTSQIDKNTDLNAAKKELKEKLERKSRASLEFVIYDLEKRHELRHPRTTDQRTTKTDFANRLADWRMTKDLEANQPLAITIRTSTMDTLKFIRKVVEETTTPTWMNTVPKEFGEKKAGTLKAAEWRDYATLYLPIALVLLWGTESSHSTKEAAAMLKRHLDHTMFLVQAIILACYRVTTDYRAEGVQTHLKNYLTELHQLYPMLDPTTNQHMSLHLGEFIKRFGPVHSWWTYPFEWLIGHLQQLPTNNKFGELESTLVKAFFNASYLRRWLSRINHPPEVRAISALFAKIFPLNRGTNNENTLIVPPEDDNMDVDVDDESMLRAPEPSRVINNLILRVIGEGKSNASSGLRFCKRIRHHGTIYSVKDSHLGNSLIEFNMMGAQTMGETEVGIIENLVLIGNPESTYAVIRKYLPINWKDDPFAEYKDFPGRIFSSKLTDPEVIEVSCIKSHVAQFCIPDSSKVVIVSLSRF